MSDTAPVPGTAPSAGAVRTRPLRGGLDAADAGAVRAVADAAATTDGVAPLSEQPLLWLTGGGPDVLHVLAEVDRSETAAREEDGGPVGPAPGGAGRDGGTAGPATPATGGVGGTGGTARDGDRTGGAAGALVGYAQVDLRDPALATAEVVVHPGHRRRGVATALLAAVGDAARARGADHVDVWAHGDLPASRALAARLGMPTTRELWQMALDPLAAPAEPLRPLPDGVTVRPFEPGRDEDAWVAVNARAFARHPEQGRLTRADLADRMAEPWFDAAGLLLAHEDGRLLAFGWTKVPEQAADGPLEGEVYALGVDPAAQGRGLGPALTARMLAHLADRGVTRVVLYTEGDNVPAIRVYRAAGFDRSAVDVVHRLT